MRISYLLSKKTQSSISLKAMKKGTEILRPVFVEQLPDLLDPGLLYVSMKFAICAHSCACGCGRKVYTPLGLKDWQLYFDGETVSLSPSIGNYDFPCRSHYFIRYNRIVWISDNSRKSGNGKSRMKQRPKKKIWKRLLGIG